MSSKVYLFLAAVMCMVFNQGLALQKPGGLMVLSRHSNSLTFSWYKVPNAVKYEARLLKTFTNDVIKSLIVTSNRVQFWGLKDNTIYGVMVTAIDRNEHRSPPAYPLTRTKTYKKRTLDFMPQVLIPPPVEECGAGKFTCDDKTCLDEDVWCNEVFECSDKSDEINCPGSCKKPDFSKFLNGNYSCTRFQSPKSLCTFVCNKGYVRYGEYYIRCRPENGTWTGELPICRLKAPKNITNLPHLTERHSLKVSWERNPEAKGYKVTKVQRKNDKGKFKKVNAKSIFTKIVDKVERNKLLAKVKKLDRGSTYKIQIAAIGKDKIIGASSKGIIAVTNDRPPKPPK